MITLVREPSNEEKLDSLVLGQEAVDVTVKSIKVNGVANIVAADISRKKISKKITKSSINEALTVIDFYGFLNSKHNRVLRIFIIKAGLIAEQNPNHNYKINLK